MLLPTRVSVSGRNKHRDREQPNALPARRTAKEDIQALMTKAEQAEFYSWVWKEGNAIKESRFYCSPAMVLRHLRRMHDDGEGHDIHDPKYHQQDPDPEPREILI